MDSDFHYFGTGAAAIKAGFSKTESQDIAFGAQFVDWFTSTNYLREWRIVGKDGSAVKDKATRKQFRYKNPQLSIQGIGLNLIREGYSPDIWNAFHFPPGNLPYDVKSQDWKKEFCDQHVVRQTNIRPKKQSDKLCRPYSKFALDLITDTVEKYEALTSNPNAGAVENLISSFVGGKRKRCPVTPDFAAQLARLFLGIRMHVFADTWAHQDFTGEQNKKINYCGRINDVHASTGKKGKLELVDWQGPTSGTDRMHMYPGITRFSYAGHSQIGMLPDFSWLKYKYPAGWMQDDDDELHIRDNPKDYTEAWSWMCFVIGLCKGNKIRRPKPTPQEIEKVIRTPHALSHTQLYAIIESEKCWKKTKLVRAFWDQVTENRTWLSSGKTPESLEELGVFEGKIVDESSFNIVRNSKLHLMEIATAMHYNFCYEWIAKNPEYTWRPAAPTT